MLEFVLCYKILIVSASQEQFVELAKLNTFCSAATHTVPIKSEAQCRAASAKLKLVFARGFYGTGDFPGCLRANDGRNKVYWNRSPRPSPTPNRPLYSAICQSSSIRPVPTGKTCSFSPALFWLVTYISVILWVELTWESFWGEHDMILNIPKRIVLTKLSITKIYLF